MGTYIVKIPCDGIDYYLEWSSIVDAPVTYGMTLDEFMSYYKSEYGNNGLRGLDKRMKRVNETGTSDTVSRRPLNEWIRGNRAGDNEAELTLDQIANEYIRNRPQDEHHE